MQRTSQGPETEKDTLYNVEKYPPIELTRRFHAAGDLVWKAWTTPELMKQWWGPKNFTCPDAKINFRMGGSYLLAMQAPDGKITYSGGVYKEIVHMERILMTDQFMDKYGNVVQPEEYGIPGIWPETTNIIVEFEGIGGSDSKISLVHWGIPKEMHEDCVSGWKTSIDKLQALVEKS